MISCAICETCHAYLLRSRLRICQRCVSHLSLLYQPRYMVWQHKKTHIPYYGLSLYLYDSLVRDWILKIKVQNDTVALFTLLDFIIDDDLIRQWLRPARLFVPSPPSSYSRLKGKLDLASSLAMHFARNAQRPLMSARTSRLKFSSKKQSFLAKTKRIKTSDYDFIANIKDYRYGAAPSAQPCIALFDDIVTSGQTMAELLSNMGSASCRIVLLACAH